MSKAETSNKRGGWKQSDRQKIKARETMKRLRKEQPEKFTKRKKKPEAKDTFPAQAASPPVAAPESQTKPGPQPATSPATPLNSPPASPPVAAPVQPSPQIQPDTVLFGSEIIPPPKIETGTAPTPPPQPPPGSPGTGAPDQPAPPPPPEVRKYAVLVWGMIIKTCCGIFGEGFKPILIKSETGEVLYDENAEGVKVWWNWLVSIGVRAFSPVVELWMFMVSYFAIRFPLIVAKFRKKKTSTTTSAPQADTERPGSPPLSKEPPPGQPPPEPPEPQPKQQPPQTTPEERAAAVEALN